MSWQCKQHGETCHSYVEGDLKELNADKVTPKTIKRWYENKHPNMDVNEYLAYIKKCIVWVEDKIGTLRMKKEYIQFVKDKRKFCTTRTKNKCLGRKRLISGSYFKPIDSGVIIDINEIFVWTMGTVTKENKELILNNEDTHREYPFDTWNNFISLLESLNKKINNFKIGVDEEMFTHFFVEVDKNV